MRTRHTRRLVVTLAICAAIMGSFASVASAGIVSDPLGKGGPKLNEPLNFGFNETHY